MGLLSDIFGIGPKVDYAELIVNGAKIIDVRTPGEYASGHVKGSINVPLNVVGSRAEELKKHKNGLVLCCASGMRSGVAKGLFKKAGFQNVVNGGSWQKVKKMKNSLV